MRSSLERLRERLAELGDLRWATTPVVQLRPFLVPAEQPTGGAEANGAIAAADEETDGRVVPLRPHQQPETVEWAPAAFDRSSPETESIERIAAEIHRIAGEAEADLRRVWRVPPVPAPGGEPAKANGSRRKAASGNGASPRRNATEAAEDAVVTPLRAATQDNKSAEARFLEALEEIRSLRRAGSNPAE